jgi:Xaa-Pro dipeptidase
MTEATMSATYAAFTEDEHRRRLARACEMLRRNAIECCISVAPEHLYYFAGYDSWVSVNSPQALIFMVDDGEPTLIVRDVDLALPHETSWVSDIRTYHLFSEDVAALIASVALEKGFRGSRLAVETQSYALPHSQPGASPGARLPSSSMPPKCSDRCVWSNRPRR